MENAYCPWCGIMVEPLCIFASTKDIEWQNCGTSGCKGNRLSTITDSQGFVIHPRHIRGRYVYSKPDKGDVKWQK